MIKYILKIHPLCRFLMRINSMLIGSEKKVTQYLFRVVCFQETAQINHSGAMFRNVQKVGGVGNMCGTI